MTIPKCTSASSTRTFPSRSTAVEIDRFFFSHNTWHIEERVGKLKVLDYLEFSPVYTEVSFMLDTPLPPPEL